MQGGGLTGCGDAIGKPSMPLPPSRAFGEAAEQNINLQEIRLQSFTELDKTHDDMNTSSESLQKRKRQALAFQNVQYKPQAQ